MAACESLIFDTRRIGRPILRYGEVVGREDGWSACPDNAREWVSVAGRSRHVCHQHAREVRTLAAAGMAARLRWTTGTPTSTTAPSGAGEVAS
jgi:hypothetical protein